MLLSLNADLSSLTTVITAQSRLSIPFGRANLLLLLVRQIIHYQAANPACAERDDQGIYGRYTMVSALSSTTLMGT